MANPPVNTVDEGEEFEYDHARSARELLEHLDQRGQLYRQLGADRLIALAGVHAQLAIAQALNKEA